MPCCFEIGSSRPHGACAAAAEAVLHLRSELELRSATPLHPSSRRPTSNYFASLWVPLRCLSELCCTLNHITTFIIGWCGNTSEMHSKSEGSCVEENLPNTEMQAGASIVRLCVAERLKSTR